MTHTTSTSSTYDDFTNPELDVSRWFFLEYPPGPDGTSWRCEEPGARTETGEGRLTIQVQKFERANAHVQIMDNPKHLLLSTEPFAVPSTGRTTFSMDMAATSINAAPRDYRDGFASMNVLDLSAGWVFDLCATSDTVFSIYERLPVPGVERPFTYIVEAPLAGIEIAPGLSHHYQVTLDASRSAAEWRVDGRLVYQALGIEIPSQVNIGLGMITLHPISGAKSQSLRGQGLTASFGPIAVDVTP